MEHEQYQLFVGVDLGRENHVAMLIDGDGKQIAERQLKHDGRDMASFVDWLRQLCGGEPQQLAVGIEVNRGTAVETLLEAGFHVYALNPKQLDRFRDRHTVAGAKDDRLDALVLADSLRTDRKAYRRLATDHPLLVELRGVVRLDRELRDDVVRLSNQLNEQLHRYFPQFLEFGSLANQAWLWELIERIPTPQHAQLVRPRDVQRILDNHKVRRLDARAVCDILRRQSLVLAPGAVDAAVFHVRKLVPRLRLAYQQRSECQRRIEELLGEIGKPPVTEATDPQGLGDRREHRDVEILLSCPGLGTRVAATMLAEASEALEQRAYHHLRSYVGVAPVTRRSGKQTVVAMRRGCSHILREAMFHWARVAIQKDTRARALYDQGRARGLTHSRMLRSVADSLLKMLCAMLRSNALYDPATRCPTAETA